MSQLDPRAQSHKNERRQSVLAHGLAIVSLWGPRRIALPSGVLLQVLHRIDATCYTAMANCHPVSRPFLSVGATDRSVISSLRVETPVTGAQGSIWAPVARTVCWRGWSVADGPHSRWIVNRMPPRSPRVVSALRIFSAWMEVETEIRLSTRLPRVSLPSGY